jgi:hypothetical protein
MNWAITASPALGLRPYQTHLKVKFQPQSTVGLMIACINTVRLLLPPAQGAMIDAVPLEWYHVVNLAISIDFHFGMRVLEHPWPPHLPPRVLALQVTNAEP